MKPEAHSPNAGDGLKMKIVSFLFVLIILAALWSAGVFNSIFAGPKIPLPRQSGDLALGADMDAVLQKFPEARKKLRPFNNDEQFRIVTLTQPAGDGAPSTQDLIFYLPNHKLYFISTMWEAEKGQKVPITDWAHQYRRWRKANTGSAENLGNNVTLKEWHFDDNTTEMVLRILDYSGKEQKWQDLRDASNDPAQTAFAKYRLETGS
ncbi:MAG TPA: hypothetical protein VHE12_08100 [bacterium]|nr:hypothetical protein [bacterium]